MNRLLKMKFMKGNSKVKMLVLCQLFVLRLAAQPVSSINLLDQNQPGSIARVFAPGIISTDAIEHSAPAFSPDGKTVFWAIMKMPSYQTRLLEINFTDNKWSMAHAPSFSDTTANEVYPHFSAGGDSLFFCSDRKQDPMASRKSTLWYVTKDARGWSEAKLLDTLAFKKDLYAHSAARNGTRYFTIGPRGTPDWNIYKTDGQGTVTPLPAPINSPGYEDGPFIAADESYLIFESDRGSGKPANIDLYISFRSAKGGWTAPMNMGPVVNTASAERFASVSHDGRYLFFGRNTGTGFDIYWMDAAIIHTLKKQAVEAGILKE
jgi:Tol biopolymer transport system component